MSNNDWITICRGFSEIRLSPGLTLLQWAERGRLLPGDYVFDRNLDSWVRAIDVTELATHYRQRRMQSRTTAVTLMVAIAVLIGVLSSGCSLRRLAVNQIGNAIAGGGSTYASDDDPELIGGALPFSLKLIETLIAESPNHTALLVAAARGFTQYGYGWVESAGDDTQSRERSKRLYLRARDYGLRALSSSIENFQARLAADPHAAVALARKRDVPALYWTAAAWGLAISGSKDDIELLADLTIVEALITRAAELDPGFESGAIDTFLITYEAARSGVSKDAEARAREHFTQAVERSGAMSASTFVVAAEALSVPAQNRAEFDELLSRALAIDPGAVPERRLENILAQRRARWLRQHADDLFLSPSWKSEGKNK